MFNILLRHAIYTPLLRKLKLFVVLCSLMYVTRSMLSHRNACPRCSSTRGMYHISTKNGNYRSALNFCNRSGSGERHNTKTCSESVATISFFVLQRFLVLVDAVLVRDGLGGFKFLDILHHLTEYNPVGRVNKRGNLPFQLLPPFHRRDRLHVACCTASVRTASLRSAAGIRTG